MNKTHLKIAYTIQNVGGIDFSNNIGDTVPVKNTLKGLHKNGHDITCFMLAGRSVIGINDISDPAKTWRPDLGISGTFPFKIAESGIRNVQKMLKLPYFAFIDSYRFNEFGRRHLSQYMLCHEHNGLFCAGTSLACRRLGLPYILTVSADPLFELELIGTPLKGLHAKVATWEAQMTYKLADKIICVSEPSKKHLVENWQVDPEKIKVMPNGVDIDLFHPEYDAGSIRTEFGLGNAPVISFVGGFQPWHGLDILVESFAHVVAKFPEAKLFLVGDGPAREKVERKIEKFGLIQSVIITGLVPQARAAEMLAVADITTLPYPRLPQELWFSPLKLYEYMAAGKAIVASRSGQIAETIQEDYSGILVEPGSATELAQAINALLKNPTKRKRLGMNARREAVQRHSWEQYITRLEEIYMSVLPGD